MPDPDVNDHAQEIEMQTRKVAAIERFIAQIDLDLRLSEEMRLLSEKARKQYINKLKQEQEYLDWLHDPDESPDA